MRKHDVRKWLHAILDLLPVILIPVFMIYSHRHEINDGSIQVQEKIAVDFNQQLTPNKSLDLVSDGALSNTVTLYTYNNFDVSHIYILKWYQNDVVTSDVRNTPILTFSNVNDIKQYYSVSSNVNLNAQFYYWRFNPVSSGNCAIQYWFHTLVSDDVVSVYDFQLFDLSQMFGVGNEPTIEEFNQLYSLSYYDYTLSHKELIDGGFVTYNDTDIMSQFTYQLYNSVDKYFNVGNVFHLGEVYDWFNLNIFNGQAPLYIFVVYQIVLYELIMDLLFLLYALFMWFIDMIQKLMEKPLNSIK